MRRRSFFAAMAGAAAVPVIPSIVRAAPASSRVFEMVADIKRMTRHLSDPDLQGRLADWETLADAQSIIVDALVEESPATVAELSAKIDALRPFFVDDEDGDLVAIVADDARALAEAA